VEVYQTEEQQIVMLKELWKKNKTIIFSFAIVFCAALFGNHVWRNYENQNNEKASNIYQDILTAMQNVDTAKVKEKGELLLKDYGKTPYAALSAMILAKVAIDEQDIPSAMAKLRTVIASGKKTPLLHVAKIKLARLLHAKGEHQAALKELDNPPNGYITLYEELKGDIFLSLNELEKAREAYKKAILHANGNPVPWVEMKLTNINTVDDVVKKGATNDSAIKSNN
jgi:predicted negative regulator of RcsB-dependent stress response